MISELIEVAKFLLGFLPWILFLLLPTDGWEPLRRAVAICFVASVVFAVKQLREGFILSWATLLFFLTCTIAFYGFGWIWLAKHMGIVANGYLAAIIWFSLIIGRPFTLQYARADLPQERWYDDALIRNSRIIAIFWGILLLVPTAFNTFRYFDPDALPDRFYLWLSLFCIILGIAYTTYFKRTKRKQRQQANKEK